MKEVVGKEMRGVAQVELLALAKSILCLTVVESLGVEHMH